MGVIDMYAYQLRKAATVDETKNFKTDAKAIQVETENGLLLESYINNLSSLTTSYGSIISRASFDETSAGQEDKMEFGGDEFMDEATKLLFEKMDRDVREREERTRREAQEREERIVKHFDDVFESQQKMIDLKMNNIEIKLSNLDQNISHLRSEMNNITSRVDSVHNRVDGIKYFIIGSVVTLLLGIGGIVYANWQVIASMLQLAQGAN